MSTATPIASPAVQTATAAASTALSSTASAARYTTEMLTSIFSKASVADKKGSDLDRMYRAKIRPMLDAVDQLRGILVNEPIKLPSIVVVGDQSSGKSSVLEALSGVALPRGQNITTRCPLVLRLVNLTAPTDEKQITVLDAAALIPAPYAIIGTHPKNEERINDLDLIGRKVEEFTARLAGRGVGVVATPIMLSVYRANSPDLTLVDLPGITRNPIGDQPKDIYKQIKEMIYQFIIPEESVILNVMPATVDFPTCECMMMSKEVDPNGERTIAVVTKMDLAEKGIRKKLEYGVSSLNLRLGLVAVRNRTQAENDAGITFEQARINEMNFFKNHAELSGMADGILGTQRLAELLTTIQEARIRSTLPKVRANVLELLETNRNQLAEMPPALRTPTDARIRYDQMLNQFVQSVSALCRGEHAPAQGQHKLHISPRLHELYLTFQQQCYQQQTQYLTAEYARIVEEEMKENNGVTLPNFVSHQVFQALVRREVKKLRIPTLSLVSSARSLLSSVLFTLASQQFRAFPLLASRLQEELSTYIDICQRTILSRVDEMLAQEEQDPFSINPYYMDTVNKVKASVQRLLTDDQKGTNATSLNVKKVGNLTQFTVNDLTCGVDLTGMARANPVTFDLQINTFAYTNLSLKRVCDAIPLIIRYHFVRQLTQPTGDGLLSKLQTTPFAMDGGEKLLELMKEQADQHVKRERLLTSIARLEEALKVFEKL